jgi:DNA-binding MarR family transcriptional regulator
MNAVAEPIAFQLPKKPRVKEKDPPPDQRKVCVLPIRAVFDKKLSHGGLQALAALCAYCNRAGITWVSQTRLAQELGMTQQAVAKQFKQLRELGYLETVRKGFKGERTDTLRVIFDSAITAEEAIAMTSKHEDNRPPVIKREEESKMDEPIDREGQRRIAQLVAGALKQPKKPKEYTMPKTGETRAVRQVKEAMAKAQSKRAQAVDKSPTIHNPQVVNEGGLHSQPNHNLQVVQNSKEHYKREVISKVLKEDLNTGCIEVMDNLEVVDSQRMRDAGMTPEQVRECLDILNPLFAAEGLKPSSRVLTDAILQLHRTAA